jgi:glycosyltransferase involved in cell wall biosynthesis
MTPFFSIITATYNASADLPGLLEGLAMQTCRDFEWVVQDGNSTDNTVALAESYRDRLPSLILKSEPDAGIYDAWNRALDRFSGQWVLFLGADDRLAGSDVLERVASLLQDAPREVLFAPGELDVVGPDRLVQYRYAGRVKNVREALRWHMPFGYPALFHRASLFSTERFDTDFRISADYEFVCRSWRSDEVGLWLGFTVTHMDVGGFSTQIGNTLLVRWDYARIASRYFTGVWTPTRVLVLAKGLVLHVISRCLGPQWAMTVLARVRTIRGLPPAWGIAAGPEDKRTRS